MSDLLLDAMYSDDPHYEILQVIGDNIPEEKHLAAISEIEPSCLTIFMNYNIKTKFDVINFCLETIERFSHYPNEDDEYCRYVMNRMESCIYNFILRGYKTKKVLDLCRYGIKMEILYFVEYQFNDLSDAEKDELLDYATERKFAAAIQFITKNK